ncbi:MAG: hypothetical protein KDA41_14605, partial [Planctomycetales bacterium]|nr:hypothetical protein [Planctomycetales bacterium]
MRRIFCGWAALAPIALAAASFGHAADVEIVEDDNEIRIDTPHLAAVVRKTGYVSGVAGGSFLDKQTGFRDRGFGLDIVDWIMEPGSDVDHRDKLPDEMIYRFGNDN